MFIIVLLIVAAAISYIAYTGLIEGIN